MHTHNMSLDQIRYLSVITPYYSIIAKTLPKNRQQEHNTANDCEHSGSPEAGFNFIAHHITLENKRD